MILKEMNKKKRKSLFTKAHKKHKITKHFKDKIIIIKTLNR